MLVAVCAAVFAVMCAADFAAGLVAVCSVLRLCCSGFIAADFAQVLLFVCGCVVVVCCCG